MRSINNVNLFVIPFQWDWFATTRNPHYEENELNFTITDDRLILLTLPKWKFGPDFTGNIMSLDNLKYLVAESKELGPILLVSYSFFSGGLGRCSLDHLDLEVYCDVALC